VPLLAACGKTHLAEERWYVATRNVFPSLVRTVQKGPGGGGNGTDGADGSGEVDEVDEDTSGGRGDGMGKADRRGGADGGGQE